MDKNIPNLGIHIEPFDKWDYESIVRNFWMCSITNRMNEFNFSEAFESLKEPIIAKLIEHGQKSFELFEDYHDNLGCHSDSEYEQFTLSTNYFNFSIQDVKTAINKGLYEVLKDAFNNFYSELNNILNDIENWHGHTLQWKIELFDSIIHAQHETADIFCDLDIDYLREQVEKEIKELL